MKRTEQIRAAHHQTMLERVPCSLLFELREMRFSDLHTADPGNVSIPGNRATFVGMGKESGVVFDPRLIRLTDALAI